MKIDQLIVEVTRRCNLRCSHCLRGEAQNRNFNPHYLEQFIKVNEIDYIGCITFSGGEPTLCPDIISQCHKILKRNDVYIDSFYISINGVYPGDKNARKFVRVVAELKYDCDDSSLSFIHISNSQFHRIERSELETFDECKKWIRKLEGIFTFVHLGQENYEEDYLLKQGRNKSGRQVTPEEFEMEENLVKGSFYLNCEGDVVAGCDYSYDTQSEYKICHCDEKVMDSAFMDSALSISEAEVQ